MLRGQIFWSFTQHVIPVYVIVLVGLGLWKLKVFQPIHAAGIARFLSVVGIPFYAFHLMAFNDPYHTSFRLLGADSLQKLTGLTIGLLYWSFAKNGKLDHVIKFFMLATLPNIVVVGDALLGPLYGPALGFENVHGKLVTLIFFQVLIWFNLVIAMYEMRIVLQESQANADEADLEWQKQCAEEKSQSKSTFSIDITGNEEESQSKSAFSIVVTGNGGQGHAKDDNKSVDNQLHYSLSRDTSEELQPSKGKGMREDVSERQDQDNKKGKKAPSRMVEVLDKAAPAAGGKRKRSNENTAVFWSLIAYKVFKRLIRVPVTCSILGGFVYSLLAYKWNWRMPYYVQTSVELISQGAIGMALFVLGMTWGASGKILLCGWKKMTFGMVVRFIVSPLIMTITSLGVGLRGENFQFAVAQAVIPQSILSFVLAKEYNVDAEEFATAAILQLVLCLPFIVTYYIVLGKV